MNYGLILAREGTEDERKLWQVIKTGVGASEISKFRIVDYLTI